TRLHTSAGCRLRTGRRGGRTVHSVGKGTIVERLNGGRDALHVHRPAEICRALLAALDAAEGRRRRRKRDQTPDAFGLRVKRELLGRVIADDPPADAFEQWLLEYPARCGKAELAGPARAMARAVYDEWRLAHSSNEFRN